MSCDRPGDVLDSKVVIRVYPEFARSSAHRAPRREANPMRRNRVIAGTSALLLGVAGLWAASLAIGSGNTPQGVPQPTTTLASGSPTSPSKPAAAAGDVRIAAVGDMNGPKTHDPDSPSGRNGAAI